MEHARGLLQSSEPTGQLPLHAIFPLAQEALAPAWSGIVVPAVFLPSQLKSARQMNGFDQTTVRSAGETRLYASVPSLMPFDFQYNKSGFSVSSATLLLLTQILVCCIDRLNPQSHTGHSLVLFNHKFRIPIIFWFARTEQG
jgi:hypothetical protein